MTREQFIMQGPRFACMQVERAVSIAQSALIDKPPGELSLDDLD